MAEPAARQLPWLDDFERDPATAVDELLRGVADVAPWERAEASEVLHMLFGGLPADDSRREGLGQTIAGWIVARRADGPEERWEYGIDRYVAELVQALVSVYLVPLPTAAARLRRELHGLQPWSRSLFAGPGWDPEGELWQVLAVHQEDRSLLESWYQLCREAGHERPEHHLDIGLIGLRRLPAADGSAEAGGRLSVEVPAGLFRWAARLSEGPANRKSFQRRLGTLLALYPRGPHRWRQLIQPLLETYPTAPFLGWLEGLGLQQGRRGHNGRGTFPQLPTFSRVTEMLRRIREEPLSEVLPDLHALIQDHERYAEATGEADFLVKTAMNFSGRLKRRAPHEALHLARLAHRWAPSDSYTWKHLANALTFLGETERAEIVLWEAVRRFPEDDVSRNALADLLAKTGRHDEAERLLRETIEAFPKNDVSRNALADLLAKTARYDEAERLLRETIEAFPKNDVSRNALADLLAKTGRQDEAEQLYRATMEVFPRDPIAPRALAFWLLRWNRRSEAKDLYQQIRASFPPTLYTRKLGEALGEAAREGEAEPALEPSALETLPNDEPQDSSIDLVAEPRPEYDPEPRDEDALETRAEDGPEPRDGEALEPDARLVRNATIGRADLALRTGEEPAEAQASLARVIEALRADPNHIYPRLVLSLHDETWAAETAEHDEAFPHAYPIRFLTAKRSGDPQAWNGLLADFEEHRPWTLLGRVVASNGDADPTDAARLASWATGAEGKASGFEAFTASRVQEWLGDEPREADAKDLLHRLKIHGSEIERLLGDALRRAADEGALNAF